MMELFALIKRILYTISFFQFIHSGVRGYVPCVEIGKVGLANPWEDIPSQDYHYIKYLYMPSDETNEELPIQCLLIQYNEEKCGGITIEGSLIYKDKNEHTINVISTNENKTKGWRTELTIQRQNIKIKGQEPHIYKMSFKKLYEFEIKSGKKENEKEVFTDNWEWYPNIMKRFDVYYSAIAATKNNKAGLFVVCKNSEEDDDIYNLNGGWVSVTPSVSSNPHSMNEVVNVANKYLRFSSLKEISDNCDPPK